MNDIIDMTKTIAPKSDQMNADDLIGGPRTITITKVTLIAGDQPCSLHYEGDGGKPYKPAKSMRRVLVHVWGKDASKYVGRSLTLYCDPEVTFGAQKVGGIRISHMSHMKEKKTMALTDKKASRKQFTVFPMEAAPAAAEKLFHVKTSQRNDGFQTVAEWSARMTQVLEKLTTLEHFNAFNEANAENIAAVRAVDAGTADAFQNDFNRRVSALAGAQ